MGLKDKLLNLMKPQPMSGGNTWETHVKLTTQEQIDINSLLNTTKIKSDTDEIISSLTDEFLREKTIEPYFLLQLQSYYFSNTIQFDCNNTRLTKSLYKVIKCAWLYGKAGLWFNRKADDIIPVYVWDVTTDIYGNITGAKVGAINEALENRKGEPQMTLMEVKGDELLVFTWGTLGLSAWIIVWPFIQYQAMLLKMLVAQGFFYNKKLMYNINNKKVVKDELKTFFNPLNIFITNLVGDDIGNKFKSMEVGGSSNTQDFITYYKEVVSIYYHLFGRKLNVDNKKERNTTTEVNASQENFDVVQSEWINQFKIFVQEINEYEWKPTWAQGLQLTMLEDTIMEEEDDREGMDESSRDKPEDNSNGGV